MDKESTPRSMFKPIRKILWVFMKGFRFLGSEWINNQLSKSADMPRFFVAGVESASAQRSSGQGAVPHRRRGLRLLQRRCPGGQKPSAARDRSFARSPAVGFLRFFGALVGLVGVSIQPTKVRLFADLRTVQFGIAFELCYSEVQISLERSSVLLHESWLSFESP